MYKYALCYVVADNIRHSYGLCLIDAYYAELKRVLGMRLILMLWIFCPNRHAYLKRQEQCLFKKYLINRRKICLSML